MKTATFFALIASLAPFSALAAPTPYDASDLASREAAANLPGLNSVQSANARAVIAENKKEGLGKQGCLAGIATGLTEASLLVYANSNVPASLKYKHDAVGSDHDSVGVSFLRFRSNVIFLFRSSGIDYDIADFPAARLHLHQYCRGHGPSTLSCSILLRDEEDFWLEDEGCGHALPGRSTLCLPRSLQ
jgi:hypothetical protein